MKEVFYRYLVNEGYSEYAPCGRKSTVYSYCNRIDLVCNIEKMTWEQLSERICVVIPKYDVGGIHENVGKRSQKTCINALRAFERFTMQRIR